MRVHKIVALDAEREVCGVFLRKISLSASASVRQASVLRGLLLRVAATASSSREEYLLISVPFGKHCRSSPLVFSFVPRCHGLCGSQKYTSNPVSIRS
jgi:hypothetical protein